MQTKLDSVIETIVDRVVRAHVTGVDILDIQIAQLYDFEGDLVLRIVVVFRGDENDYVNGEQAYGLGYYISEALDDAVAKGELDQNDGDFGLPMLSYVANAEVSQSGRALC